MVLDANASTAASCSRLTNATDDAHAHRAPLPAETCAYEITGLAPAGNRFTFAEMLDGLDGAAGIDYEAAPSSGVEKRLVEQTRTLYRPDDGSETALGLGAAQGRGLPYESYTKALTPGLLANADAYDGRVTQSMLDAAGYAYFASNEHRWARSGRLRFSPTTLPQGVSAAEFAATHFFLPWRFVDPFDHESSVTYDAHDLLVAETEDALGNTTAIVNDFRVLAPSMVTDPNGNRTAFAFDELGLVTKTAAMGKSGANEGDDLDHPTAKFEYDFDIYRTEGTPVFVKTEIRETHFFPAAPDPDNAPRRIAYLYSDGLGREVQTKIQAEPGPVPGVTGTVDPRWVGSGWTIYNNKGMPVRKYEPFFSDTSDFEFAREEGVSPIVFYDPLGRAVGTLHPDHTYEKIVFDPWKQETWDRNDTHELVTDPTSDSHLGGLFSRLDDGFYGTDHYVDQVPSYHHNTPTTKYFDPLGRAFLVREIAANGTTTDRLDTRTVLDIEGNVLQADDPRISALVINIYDTAGRVVRTISKDSGTRVLFNDVHGQPLYTWDNRDHRFRTEYDELRRPHKVFLSEDDGVTESLIEQTVFGDDPNDAPANPQNNNLLGRPYIRRDGGGETVFDSYDFKGNPLSTTRILAQDFQSVLDWSGTVTLESEAFATSLTYDALNRIVAKTTPDGSVTTSAYNEAGLLESVTVGIRGGDAEVFVRNVDYNARGQRTKIEYRENSGDPVVETASEYDDATSRLLRQVSTRVSDAAVLQDLNFTYDPVGNIREIVDDAQQSVYFDNGYTDGTRDFTYDSLYRLTVATGREHAGQQPQPDEYGIYGLPHPNDTDALIRFTQTYTYDASGNIAEMAHAASGNNWTQAYSYATGSNHLTQTQIGSTPLSYTHDAHGNMMLPHLTLQTWDYRDRLRKSSTQDAGSDIPETTYYVYDAAGRRTRKVTENFATQGNTPTRKCETIYLDDYEIYREYTSGSLNDQREILHVMDPSTSSGRIAMAEALTWDGGQEITSPTFVYRFQLSDHLGSSAVETNEDGDVITYEEYYPYGGTSFHSANGSISQKRYRYNAKEKDGETSLYYYGARYYASWLGRWTACDPAGMVDGPNRYVYVKNNPVSISDSDGKQSLGLQFTDASPVSTQEQAEARVKFSKEAATGIAQSAKATAAGLKELAVGLARRSVNAVRDPADFKAAWNETAQTAKAVANDPKGVAKAAVIAAVEPYEKALEEGRPGEVYGRMVFALGAISAGTAVVKTATALRAEKALMAESAVAKGGLRAADTEISLAGKVEKAVASVAEESELTPKLSNIEQSTPKQATLRRPYLRKNTLDTIEKNAPRDKYGQPIDPNTRQPITGRPDVGHKYGLEYRRLKADAEGQGLTQAEFNEQMNNPDLYQLEDSSGNRSRRFEKKP